MENALIICLELVAGAAIIIGFIYEKKLIAFEDRVVLLLKKIIKSQAVTRLLRVEKHARAKRCA